MRPAEQPTATGQAITTAEALSRIPGVQKVEDDNLPALQAVVSRYTWRDPYAGSAAYYGLTGRNGLWLAARDGGIMVMAEHPHRPGKVLLFPPAGQWQRVLGAVLRSLPPLPEGYQFARMPAGQSAAMAAFTGWAVPHAAPAGNTEDVLDWHYPVHVLSCQDVARREGRAFHDFRKNVRRVPADRMSAEPLRPDAHRSAIEAIAQAWALQRGPDSDDALTARTEPYRRLLDLMAYLPVRGRLHRMDGQPVGFTIWEETDPRRGVANSLADLTTRQVKGLSEFVYADMCAELAERGFSRVCIGGSEEPGLDLFKCKMQPADSVKLVSLHYRLSGPAPAHPLHTKGPAPAPASLG